VTEARWLSLPHAAEHLDLSVDAFRRYVRQRKLPQPDRSLGPRQPRWDREELDAIFSRDTASSDASRAVQNLVEKIHAQPRPRRQAQAR
jgi:predicted DNA-binding transcriptional regulator AlpA